MVLLKLNTKIGFCYSKKLINMRHYLFFHFPNRRWISNLFAHPPDHLNHLILLIIIFIRENILSINPCLGKV